MQRLEAFFSQLCGRPRVASQSHTDTQESKENSTDPIIIPTHNPFDLKHLLYDALDPMPLDLIKIIMEYDVYHLKGELALNHEITGWVDALIQLNDEVIVLGSHDGTLLFVSIKTGEIIKTIKAHARHIFELGALLNGRLFSVSADRSIKYWDMFKKFACVKSKNLVIDDEKAIVTAPCMTCVARDLIESGLFSGQIRLCDAKTGTLRCKIMIPRDATDIGKHSERDIRYITALAPIVHDGIDHEFQYVEGAVIANDALTQSIFTASEAELKSSDTRDYDGKYVHDITLYDDYSKTVTGAIPMGSFTWLIKLSNGLWVSDDAADHHEIRLWNGKTGRCETLIKVDQSIRAMTPLHNGMIAVGLSDTNTRIIDPKTTMTVAILNHGAFIKGLETLHKGLLASFGAGGVKIWR